MNRLKAPSRDVAAIALLWLLVIACTWRIALAGRVLAGGDVFTYFYPYWTAATGAIRAARLPSWNPSLFMGVPFVANSQVGFFYPLNWPLWLLLPAHRSVHVSIVLHLCLAALNAYLWGRRALRLNRVASWTVGAVFALGGYLGAQMEHVNQLQGLAWLPLMVMFSHRTVHQRRDDDRALSGRLRACCAFAAVTGLVLLAGHTQTAFISLFGAMVYAWAPPLWRSLHGADWKPVIRGGLLLVTGVLLGATLAAVQLFPTWQLSRLSVRARGLPFNERVSFSLSPLYAGRALLPSFGRAIPLDHIEHVAYVGVIGLALTLTGLVIGLRRQPDRSGRPVIARNAVWLLLLLGLVFALGLYSPVYVFLARYIPGFAHFRVPARWLALYGIGVAALAGLAVQKLWQGRPPGRPRVFSVAGIVSLLILWAVVGARLGGAGGVGLPNVLAWTGLAFVSTGLLLAARRSPRAATVSLLVLLVGELFLAARALPQARATAPQAFTSLRPAVAHLLASQHDAGVPPERFLSMSDTTFDPGDLSLIRTIYGPQLSDAQLYDYVIATKQKEILSPNLPLAFDVAAVDGYDGGVLPLRHYVLLQRAFLPADEVSIDGRLRENLTRIPEGRWLSLFNVRYVITDKLRDAWVDDVFYDLQFGARLSRGERAVVTEVPQFEATALGLVSRLQHGQTLPDGAPVGSVRVAFSDGSDRTFELSAKEVFQGPAHQETGEGTATRLRWPEPGSPLTITVEARLPALEWIVRGVSLIDERTGSFQSLVLSDQGRFRLVHSGDVKIYENVGALPRAFIVPQARAFDDHEAALQAMRDPSFDPASQVVLSGNDASCDRRGASLGAVAREATGEPSRVTGATVTSYRPEQVVIEATLDRPGYLLLTDAHYPGWRATVDGERAPICRADLLFRAVPLEPGEHRVVFSFRPPLQRVGIAVSVVALLLLLLVWRQRRAHPPRCRKGGAML
jgi:hypothetical protein